MLGMYAPSFVTGKGRETRVAPGGGGGRRALRRRRRACATGAPSRTTLAASSFGRRVEPVLRRRDRGGGKVSLRVSASLGGGAAERASAQNVQAAADVAAFAVAGAA